MAKATAGEGARAASGRGPAIGLAAAALVAAGMVGWLLLGGGRARLAQRGGVASTEPAASRPADDAASAPAGPGSPTAPDAAPPVAAETPAAPAAIADPAAELRRALLAADREAVTDADVLEAKRLLEHVLRAHPELADEVARALGELQNRKLAFVISRVLGRFVRVPEVRQVLLEHVRGGSEIAREAAIYTFVGLRDDPEVAAAIATGFTDRAAPTRVRTAAAFGLVEMLPGLPGPELEAVRAEARAVVIAPDADAEMRAEALDLLDVRESAQDRGTARHLLEAAGVGVPSNVTLAAARVLLTTGEPEERVLPHLQRLADQGLDGMAQRSLKAILDEIRAGGSGAGD